mgnify:CR=1 FL=1
MDVHYPAFDEVKKRIWSLTSDIQDLLQDKLGDNLTYNALSEIVVEIEDMQFECVDELRELFGEDDDT